MAFLDELMRAFQTQQQPPTMPIDDTGQMLQQWLEAQQRGPQPAQEGVPFFGGGGPGILANIPSPELMPQPQAPKVAQAPASAPPMSISPPPPGALAQEPQQTTGGLPDPYGMPEREFLSAHLNKPQGPGAQLPPGAMPTQGPMPFGIAPSGPAASPAQGPGSAIPNRVAPQGPDMLGGLGNALGDMFRGTNFSGGIIGGMVAGQDRRQSANATIQFMKGKGATDAEISYMMANPPAAQAWLAQNMPVRRFGTKLDLKRDGEETSVIQHPDTGALSYPVIAGAPSPGAGVPKPPTGFQWADPNDKSKGYSPVPGGPATQLPAEAAGRLAMMETAQKDLSAARKVFSEKWGLGGFAQELASKSGVGMFAGDIGLARRSVRTAIEGALRAMTGAAAPDSEVARYEDMYMPNANDNKASAMQKLKLLEDFMNNARSLVTQGRTPTTGTPPAPKIKTYNRETGKFE